jgi:hypothetical protein
VRRNIGWKITTFVLLVCLVVVAAVYHRLLFPEPQVIIPGIGPLKADGTPKYPGVAARRGQVGGRPGAPPSRSDRGERGAGRTRGAS